MFIFPTLPKKKKPHLSKKYNILLLVKHLWSSSISRLAECFQAPNVLKRSKKSFLCTTCALLHLVFFFFFFFFTLFNLLPVLVLGRSWANLVTSNTYWEASSCTPRGLNLGFCGSLGIFLKFCEIISGFIKSMRIRGTPGSVRINFFLIFQI